MKTPRRELPRATDRNERLKAALQANIARRKAQTRARDAGTDSAKGADDATDLPDTGKTED